jgi:hypothetical protein
MNQEKTMAKASSAPGKHSLAKEIFANFSKDYLTLYDEPFDRSFTDQQKRSSTAA